MPIDIQILAKQELGIARIHGFVTGETIVDAAEALYTSADWEQGFNAMWDARGIDELVVSVGDVVHIVKGLRHLDPSAGTGCTAIVVDQTMHFAFAKLIEVKVKQSLRRRRVFRSVDAAIAWMLATDARATVKRREGVRDVPTLLES